MDKAKLHDEICMELNKLYVDKNHDYGDSFGKGFKEYGIIMPIIRLEDKLNRLKMLIKSENKVDESIDDTLRDLANYAIMTLIEYREEEVESFDKQLEEVAEVAKKIEPKQIKEYECLDGNEFKTRPKRIKKYCNKECIKTDELTEPNPLKEAYKDFINNPAPF